MKRTRGIVKRYAEVPDEMCRSGMIRTRIIKVDDITIHSYTKGNSKIRVYGEQLIERDFGVFVAIVELFKENINQRITGHLSDIAKAEGLKNINDPDSLISIIHSINKLFDINIRIKPINDVGFSGAFHLVSGWIDSDGTFDLSVTSYLEKIKELGLDITLIDLNIYQATINQLARAMVRVLSTHDIFFKHWENRYYEISLRKFLVVLGYDTTGLKWYQIRPRIIKAIEECIRIGFFDRKSHPKYLSQADRKRCKNDGGILKLYPAMIKLEEKNKPTLKEIKDNPCPCKFQFGKDYCRYEGCFNCENNEPKTFWKCSIALRT